MIECHFHWLQQRCMPSPLNARSTSPHRLSAPSFISNDLIFALLNHPSEDILNISNIQFHMEFRRRVRNFMHLILSAILYFTFLLCSTFIVFLFFFLFFFLSLILVFVFVGITVFTSLWRISFPTYMQYLRLNKQRSKEIKSRLLILLSWKKSRLYRRLRKEA
jgi:ABC-type multidrug transport system fused ATPase/permease subunit